MRTFLLIFFSLISIHSVALSGYEEAVDFAKKKDYKQSIAEFIKVAKEVIDLEIKALSKFHNQRSLLPVLEQYQNSNPLYSIDCLLPYKPHVFLSKH